MPSSRCPGPRAWPPRQETVITNDGLYLNLWSLLRKKGVLAGAEAELDALLGALEEEVNWGGERTRKATWTLALAWSHHPSRPDHARAVAFARSAAEGVFQRDLRALDILAEVEARSGNLVGAILTLEEATRLPGEVSGLRRRLEELRRSILPDLATYRSIDDALEALDREEIVAEGASWRYFPGMEEPSEGLRWTALDFPHGDWKEGPSGFGYGEGDDATVVEELRGKCLGLYIWKRFPVADRGSLRRLTLSVRSDDGFVAYLNESEIGRARAGKPGERISFDRPSDVTVESAQETEIIIDMTKLGAENCLAIQGLNSHLGSSDFTLIPVLRAERLPDPARDRKLFEDFEAGGSSPGKDDRLAYLEARILQRSGRHDEARAKLLDLRKKDHSPEPCLRLAESLRVLEKSTEAEETLRAAVRDSDTGSRALWDLWSEVARVDLEQSPAKVLASIPLDDPRCWWTLGSARWDERRKSLLLTEPESEQTGRAFLRMPLPLGSFTVEFEARFEEPGGFSGKGADGLTLAFVQDPEYLPAGGGSMDFGGDGHAVELDTFPHEYTKDPQDPHIAVIRRRLADGYAHAEHLAFAQIPGGFPRDVWHPVRVDLRDGVISVSLGDDKLISDFRIPDFTPTVGYIGFTAATGGGFQRHLVRRIRFQFPPFEDAPDSPARR